MSQISLDAPKLFVFPGNVALVTGAGSQRYRPTHRHGTRPSAVPDVGCSTRRTDDGLAKTAGFIEKADVAASRSPQTSPAVRRSTTRLRVRKRNWAADPRA